MLKAEGMAKLDDLVSKMGVHRAGSHHRRRSHRLGRQRCIQPDAVHQARRSRQGLLGEQGVEANRVYTEGKGKKAPVADNKTADGRAKNRRTEIEVVGTRRK